MFKNYFKIAIRNIVKSKVYSFINIIGLSFGMAVALLIGLWMYDELSFNKNFDNHDRIAQVIQNVTNNGEVQTWRSVPYPLAEELRKNYGRDFKRIILQAQGGDHIVSLDQKKLKKQGAFFEKGIAEMLSLNMERGDWKSLDDPSSVFLSASAAKAYFGDQDPINKMIRIDDLPLVKVTGVYKDFPKNSNFNNLDFIANWEFIWNNSPWMKTMDDPWRPNAFTLYVQLNDNANFVKASTAIRDAKLKKVNPQLAKKKPVLFLQPMDQWHLYSAYKNGVNTGGAIQYVRLFGIIGVFVLLLACINFMNLSTARSEKRAKEVGIRKTIGSMRTQIIIQFFAESLLTVLLAFVLSLLLVQLALPFFNQVADKEMSILWTRPLFWALCLGFALVTGIIAGSYPAFYLSSFKPIKVLKGTFKAGRLASVPRRALVVLQFTVSVTLIIGTIVVYRQIQFAKDRPVGYTREGVVVIPTMNEAIHKHFDVVRNQLVQDGVISSMTESGSSTTGVWNSTSGLSWPGKDPNLSTDFGVVSVGNDYGKTIGWEIKEGRDFSNAFPGDSASFVVNEAAARFMGLKNPIGTPMTWWGHPFTIVGVVHNMIMESPYEESRPIIYNLTSDAGNVAILKISSSTSIKNALTKIEPLFKSTNPDQPFEFQFADTEYARKFFDEERIGKLASFFALLAIAISCLGLFGLASFVAEQRKKEIGVRKVLGASVFNIWSLLSNDFMILIAISFVLASALAYYFMHGWLQNYTYRTDLSWWIFAVAGFGSLFITVSVVSFQAIKAALSNPVTSLRSE